MLRHRAAGAQPTSRGALGLLAVPFLFGAAAAAMAATAGLGGSDVLHATSWSGMWIADALGVAAERWHADGYGWSAVALLAVLGARRRVSGATQRSALEKFGLFVALATTGRPRGGASQEAGTLSAGVEGWDANGCEWSAMGLLIILGVSAAAQRSAQKQLGLAATWAALAGRGGNFAAQIATTQPAQKGKLQFPTDPRRC